jgi:hypothetical protein
LFPVPPAMSAKMRAALYPSGAKDDPRDADLLLDLLLQHRDKLRRLSPDSEATRRVQNFAACFPSAALYSQDWLFLLAVNPE